MQTETILDHYLACLFWSECQENGRPFDDDFYPDDLAPCQREKALETVQNFLALVKEEGVDISSLNEEQIGHDLCLTSNGHGAGFWDRGLGQLGNKLTELSKGFGASLYVGDDGLVYLF